MYNQNSKPPMRNRSNFALEVFDVITSQPGISLDQICARMSLFRPEAAVATGELLDRGAIERTEDGFIVRVRKPKGPPVLGRKARLRDWVAGQR